MVASFSQLRITALVRSEKGAEVLQQQYSNVQTQVGGLEGVDLLSKLAAQHDIVISTTPFPLGQLPSHQLSNILELTNLLDCGPDVFYHEAIEAMLQAMASQNKPVFYIGTSGASSIWDRPVGEEGSKVWDDVADIDEILSLPEDKTHVVTDRIILSANTDLVHTAVVSPTLVVGISPSKSHATPLSFPHMFHVIKELGAGFLINEGRNLTCFVDANSVAGLYVRLVEDALGKIAGTRGSPEPGMRAWGPQAYYFASNVEMSQRDFMDMVVAELKRQNVSFLHSTEVKQVSHQEVADAVFKLFSGVVGPEVWAAHVGEMFGVNMRCRGSRAEKVFGFDWTTAGADAGIVESVRVHAAEAS